MIERIKARFYGDGVVGNSRKLPGATVITHDVDRGDKALDDEYVIVRVAELAVLEREAAIGRSVPWESITNSVGTSMAFVGGPNDVVEWLDTYAPKEAAE